MAKPDEAYIPFGDKTAWPGFRGYWYKFLGTSRRRVQAELGYAVAKETGVRVIKVKLVPVK